MKDQEIIDNAPEGATHVDIDLTYWDIRACNDNPIVWDDDKWFATDDIPTAFAMLRSLADIKRIVELEGFNVGLAGESCAQQKRIAELEKERIKLLSCLLDISDGCIGEITMNYRVDAEYIGRKIYAATGMTNPQLTEALKEQE